MNKRIQELAEQAAVVYEKTLPPATLSTPLYLKDKLGEFAKAAGIEIVSDGFCEKFAELMIAEFLDVVKSTANELAEIYIKQGSSEEEVMMRVNGALAVMGHIRERFKD